MAINNDFGKNNLPMQNEQLPPAGPAGSVTTDKGGGQTPLRNPVPLEQGSMNPRAPSQPKQSSGGDDFTQSTPITGDGPPSIVQQDWLQMARENYNISNNWFDISIRKRVEDNIAHSQSRHRAGSKYYDPTYDKRSRYFRPKTRSMMRQQEAACAIAFFSTMDVVACEPLDDDNGDQALAAAIHTELLNYRLRNDVPWFKTLLGGHMDTQQQGVVISCQEWEYKEATITDDEFDGSGNATGNSRTTTKVVRDRPKVRLIPCENLRVHPSCDWSDPINSSPYLIEQIPYFANELAERIAKGIEYGSTVPYIRNFSEQELMSGSTNQDNTTSSLRMQREAVRLDRFSSVQQGTKFKPVWVHRNIVRIDGLDYVYETLGTTMLLSDPVPIEEVFGVDFRPYVMGSKTIESHRPYPAGDIEMIGPTQEVMNELQNTRMDNIRLALNNRFMVKRGQMVDMRSLMRNVPGSVTLTSDPASDVKQLETKDVTSSSYQEQDRLNMDFDATIGVFTQSTVGAARNLNERVRGMELMGQGADMITELGLRTLSETWVKPVLQQLVELESRFETDETILAIVGSRSQTGGWMEVFKLLTKPVSVTVSVGFGNTDPMQRIQRLSMGLQAVSQLAPSMMQGSDANEITKEIMGTLGFQSGKRFFPALAQKNGQVDPQVQNLQQQISQLQRELQSEQQKFASQEKIAQIRADSSVNIANIRSKSAENIALGKQAADHYKTLVTQQIKSVDQQISQGGNVIKQAQLLLEREALSNAIMQADRQFEYELMMAGRAPPPTAPHVAVPAEDIPFIDSLQRPASSSVLSATNGKPPKLPGNDMAGEMARNDYGALPGAPG